MIHDITDEQRTARLRASLKKARERTDWLLANPVLPEQQSICSFKKGDYVYIRTTDCEVVGIIAHYAECYSGYFMYYYRPEDNCHFGASVIWSIDVLEIRQANASEKALVNMKLSEIDKVWYPQYNELRRY